jgi:hypothetical protein
MRNALLALATIAVCSSTASSFASESAQMRVSVQVVARAVLTIEQQPASVEVTAADVARGYVQLDHAVGFNVRSNARNGYVIRFEQISTVFSKAIVSWSNFLVTVGADGAWIRQPGGVTNLRDALSMRLWLAPATQPGTYSFPVVVSAEAA